MSAGAAAAVRQERTTQRGVSLWSGYGGTLTLAGDKLIWARGGIRRRKTLEIQLARASFGLGARAPAIGRIVFMPAWGWLVELLSGGFRRTLEVITPDDSYWFAVKDVPTWLEEIRRHGGTIVD